MAYKVVDADTLDNDLKSVADAIREKSGTTEALNFPDGFTSAIESIEAGGGEVEIGKPYIDTSKMTSFYYFCYKGNNLDVIDGLDTSNGTDFSYMFSSCGKLKTIPQLDTSKGTNFSNMFYACSELNNIPLLDTSNGNNFSYMFYQCYYIRTIPQLDTSKGTNFASMFYQSYIESVPLLDISNGTKFDSMFRYCTKLKTVSFTTAKSDFGTISFQNCTALKNITIGEGWAVNIYLHYSNELTVESLHGMIENLADLTGLTAKIFQIGATNLAKVDEAHIAMLESKNWTYS